MISGCERKDLFKNSQFSPASLIEIGVNQLDPNHQTGTVNFYESDYLSINGIAYNVCRPLHLSLQADDGLMAAEDITAGLECNGQCEFYSDDTCTTSITNATIPKESLISNTFYIKPTAAHLSLKTTVEKPYTGSCVSNIAVIATYDFIDAQYLWSVHNISELGYDITANDIRDDDAWIFQTWDGYRGKIFITERSSSAGGLTGDTLNFSEVTWNSVYPHTVKVETTETIVASGDTGEKCYMDLSMNPVVVNVNGKTVDLWWGISGGNLIFAPQNGTIFRRIPRSGE